MLSVPMPGMMIDHRWMRDGTLHQKPLSPELHLSPHFLLHFLPHDGPASVKNRTALQRTRLYKDGARFQKHMPTLEARYGGQGALLLLDEFG